MALRRASGQPGLIDRVRWGNLGRLAALLAAGVTIGLGVLGGDEPPSPPPGAEPFLRPADPALGDLGRPTGPRAGPRKRATKRRPPRADRRRADRSGRPARRAREQGDEVETAEVDPAAPAPVASPPVRRASPSGAGARRPATASQRPRPLRPSAPRPHRHQLQPRPRPRRRAAHPAAEEAPRPSSCDAGTRDASGQGSRSVTGCCLRTAVDTVRLLPGRADRNPAGESPRPPPAPGPPACARCRRAGRRPSRRGCGRSRSGSAPPRATRAPLRTSSAPGGSRPPAPGCRRG